ncbi:glyoxylase-like metal-dependent hydrolase (beta-lactamase superfamily II) [Catenuloplanes indicus]|uniref:Glyoxylase-like metal-dependent hydrolase (Beta-lactamase superfamily II) n=2 Tax=Catenuloplanes indicus TaxID=137267 RepID=A0AAE3W276_9ACTN|nr:glyoxylase-like metal-dependent hydrolase (beta-lactamase superfamily II) [Catenuloplanes indicus]
MTLDGTNTWVLRAPEAERSTVVDPGPDMAEHLAAIAEHRPFAAILITHGHADHVEGAQALSDLLGGTPVLAADPRHGVPFGDVSIDGLTIEVLRTPGHTHDSVSFVASAGDERVVLTGDTILGRGTTVVAWPDGDLGDYLASLERLSAYRGVVALPGHGPALADTGAAAAFYHAHRIARLDQVRDAVRAGASTAPEVVARVYADVDRSLWWAAEWSVRAQLDYLHGLDREFPSGSAGLDPP